MKALHEIPAPPPIYLDFDEDEDEGGDEPICPHCASRRFIRIIWENTKQEHSLDFTRNPHGHDDFNTIDGEITDSDPWECDECGRACPDWLSDLIDELR